MTATTLATWLAAELGHLTKADGDVVTVRSPTVMVRLLATVEGSEFGVSVEGVRLDGGRPEDVRSAALDVSELMNTLVRLRRRAYSPLRIVA